MRDEKMPKPKIVQPLSMLLLPSPALLLAEAEAELEAKTMRLLAQEGPSMAKGKKGRPGRFSRLLRYLWGKIRPSKADSEGIAKFLSPSGPYPRSEVHHAEQPGRPERKGELGKKLLKD